MGMSEKALAGQTAKRADPAKAANSTGQQNGAGGSRRKRGKRVVGLAAVALLAAAAVIVVWVLSPGQPLDLAQFSDALPAAVLPAAGGVALDPDVEGFQTAAENAAFRLEVDVGETAFRVVDKATGRTWNGGYPPEEYVGKVIPRDKRIMQTLLNISVTDYDAIEETIGNVADGVETAFRPLDGGVEFRFSFTEYAIAVSMQLYLDDTGFRVRIPRDQIEESGNFGIIQISALPSFGSIQEGADGHILYPAGNGVLYDCKKGSGHRQAHTQDVYGSHIMDLDAAEKIAESGQKGILLPAFGSAEPEKGKGFVAYIEEGSEYFSLTFVPSTASFFLNRVYASAVYRRIMPRMAPDNKEVFITEKGLADTDPCIKYLLLSDGDANYSGMARALRSYMQTTGRLPTESHCGDSIPLALGLLMGTNESNLLGKTGLAMTTFRQAGDMLNELADMGVKSGMVTLLGWQKEGYGEYPSSADRAGYLGSAEDFRTLLGGGTAGYSVFLQTDYVTATEGGRFSKQADIVFSFINQPVTNALQSKFLLNPYIRYRQLANRDMAAFKKAGALGLAFDSLSEWLPSDYAKGRRLTASDSKGIYASMLRLGRDEGLRTAVQRGADYLLPYAEYLYDVCEGDSGLFAFTRSVPFYQLVVHGLIPYSGEIPGNMSGDFARQRLQWAEYGSMPYFLLSEKPANALRDTAVDDVFSSRFDDWKDAAVDLWREFNDRLGPVASSQMTAHEVLDNGLVAVSYDSGYTVYVNYTDSALDAGGTQVPAMDYVVVENGGKERLP